MEFCLSHGRSYLILKPRRLNRPRGFIHCLSVIILTVTLPPAMLTLPPLSAFIMYSPRPLSARTPGKSGILISPEGQEAQTVISISPLRRTPEKHAVPPQCRSTLVISSQLIKRLSNTASASTPLVSRYSKNRHRRAFIIFKSSTSKVIIATALPSVFPQYGVPRAIRTSGLRRALCPPPPEICPL